MGRHQFLITLLLVCEKWMRTSTRPSLGGCARARLSVTWGLGCPVGVGWMQAPACGSALLVTWFVRWVNI